MSVETALAHVTVRADTTQVVPDINAAGSSILAALAKLSSSLSQKASETFAGALASLEHLKTGVGAIAGMLGGIGLGFSSYQLLSIGQHAIQQAKEASAAEAKLEAVLKGVGNVAGFTKEQLVSMAEGLAMITNFDGTEIKAAMAALIPYGIKTEEEFRRIVVAAQDVVTIYGGSLRQTVQSLAQALADPERGLGALSRQGFKFSTEQRKLIKELTETGRAAEAQSIIWDVISGQEGAARMAAGDTSKGLKKLQKDYDNLTEALGRRLMPVQAAFTEMQLRFKVLLLPVVEVIGQIVGAVLKFNNALAGAPVIIAGTIAAIGSLVLAVAGGAIAISSILEVVSGGTFTVVLAIGAAIGAIIAAVSVAIGYIASLKEVQDSWRKSIAYITQAWTNLYNAASTTISQIYRLIDTFLGGSLTGWKTWWNTVVGGFGGAFAKALDIYVDFVLDYMEWGTVLLRNWQAVVMNFVPVVKLAVFMIHDTFKNLADAIPQLFGYALYLSSNVFVKFLRGYATLMGNVLMKIPELITQFNKAILEAMITGVLPDFAKIFDTMMGDAIKGFTDGLTGTAPKIEELFKMSEETRRLIDSDPLLKKLFDEKAALEAGRSMGKEGGNTPARPFVAAPEAQPYTRIGFAGLGKKVQEELLKKGQSLSEQQLMVMKSQLTVQEQTRDALQNQKPVLMPDARLGP